MGRTLHKRAELRSIQAHWGMMPLDLTEELDSKRTIMPHRHDRKEWSHIWKHRISGPLRRNWIPRELLCLIGMIVKSGLTYGSTELLIIQGLHVTAVGLVDQYAVRYFFFCRILSGLASFR